MPKSYSCEDHDGCGFVIWKIIAGKQINRKHIDSLLEKGTTEVINGLISREGKTFSARLVVRKEDRKIVFEFPARKFKKESRRK